MTIRLPAPKVEYAELTHENNSVRIGFDMNVEGRDECGKIFDKKTLKVLDGGKGMINDEKTRKSLLFQGFNIMQFSQRFFHELGKKIQGVYCETTHNPSFVFFVEIR